MLTDSTGYWAFFDMVRLDVWLPTDDIMKIFSGHVGVKEDQSDPTNLKIQNSAEIKNPLLIYAYSFYLKHVKYPDYFTGTASGIAAEWI